MAGVPGSEMMAKQILATAGIADPQPGKWYPQQAWLDAFKKLADEVGPRTLQSIGKAIPENAKWPPTVHDDRDRDAEHRHRLSHEPPWRRHRHVRLPEDRRPERQDGLPEPVPVRVDREIIMSVAKRFKPADVAAVNTVHDDTQPCRSKGGDSCTYVITW